MSGNLGRTFTPEHRQKISIAITGRKHSEATKRRLSEQRKGKRTGSENPNWRGGNWRNPEYARVVNADRIAQRRGVENTLTLDEWLGVLAKYDHRCVYCFGEFEQLDHVVGLARGGGNTKDNVVPACKDCNKRKVGKASGWVPSIASPFWPRVAEELYA